MWNMWNMWNFWPLVLLSRLVIGTNTIETNLHLLQLTDQKWADIEGQFLPQPNIRSPSLCHLMFNIRSPAVNSFTFNESSKTCFMANIPGPFHYVFQPNGTMIYVNHPTTPRTTHVLMVGDTQTPVDFSFDKENSPPLTYPYWHHEVLTGSVLLKSLTGIMQCGGQRPDMSISPHCSEVKFGGLTGLPKASFATPRVDASVIELDSGRSWVAGGLIDSGISLTATTEVYDPKQDRWEPGPDLPVATARHCIIGPLGPDANEYLLVTGHVDCNATHLCLGAKAYIFSWKTMVWVPSGELEVPRAYITCGMVTNGYGHTVVAVIGGYVNREDLKQCTPPCDILRNTVEIYEPHKRRWVVGPPGPRGLMGFVLLSVKGEIITMGGLFTTSRNNLNYHTATPTDFSASMNIETWAWRRDLQLANPQARLAWVEYDI